MSPRQLLRRPVVLVLLAMQLAAPVAALAAPPPRANLADIEREVMCPTCGTTLMVADSPLADRERAFITSRIARGETKQQIERDLVAQFGPAILASPPEHGFSLLAYLLPGGAIAVALAGVGFGLRRWRRPSPADTAFAPPLEGPLARRLDHDMARYDL